MSTAIPEREDKPTISKDKEERTKCRSSRGSTTSTLHEAKAEQLTKEEWQKVEKYLPLMYKQINLALNRLVRYNYFFNDADIRDKGLDYLINAVHRSSKRENTPEKIDYRIRVYMAYLPRHLVDQHIKKTKRRGNEIQDCKNILDTKNAQDPKTMEMVIEECGGLSKKAKDLLLRVAYKRPEERLQDIMGPKALRVWWLKVRPMLREWARRSGLADG